MKTCQCKNSTWKESLPNSRYLNLDGKVESSHASGRIEEDEQDDDDKMSMRKVTHDDKRFPYIQVF